MVKGTKARKDIPQELWRLILATMPIACVDIIIHKKIKRKTWVLLGYRKIYPYTNCWALPGGRIIKNESLREAANRQLTEIGLSMTDSFRLVGVYPVNFKRRSDVSICVSTRSSLSQEPQPTKELVRYKWRDISDLPSNLGINYRRMLIDFKSRHYRVR